MTEDNLRITVHDKDSFFFRVSNKFLDQQLIQELPGQKIYLPIQTVVTQRLSTAGEPCNKTGTSRSWKQCLQLYIDEVTGCQMPWSPDKIDKYEDYYLGALFDMLAHLIYRVNKCNLSSTINALQSTSLPAVMSYMTEARISTMTGCKPPCSYKTYRHLPSTANKFPTANSSNLVGVGIFFHSNIEIHRKEFLAYDSFSLVGEMGGFFGLFLGLSFYQIAIAIADRSVRYCKSMVRSNKSAILLM